ncbi:MAG: hypothetical protein ACJ76L_06415 [Conexibacter sp.]
MERAFEDNFAFDGAEAACEVHPGEGRPVGLGRDGEIPGGSRSDKRTEEDGGANDGKKQLAELHVNKPRFNVDE